MKEKLFLYENTLYSSKDSNKIEIKKERKKYFIIYTRLMTPSIILILNLLIKQCFGSNLENLNGNIVLPEAKIFVTTDKNRTFFTFGEDACFDCVSAFNYIHNTLSEILIKTNIESLSPKEEFEEGIKNENKLFFIQSVAYVFRFEKNLELMPLLYAYAKSATCDFYNIGKGSIEDKDVYDIGRGFLLVTGYGTYAEIQKLIDANNQTNQHKLDIDVKTNPSLLDSHNFSSSVAQCLYFLKVMKNVKGSRSEMVVQMIEILRPYGYMKACNSYLVESYLKTVEDFVVSWNKSIKKRVGIYFLK